MIQYTTNMEQGAKIASFGIKASTAPMRFDENGVLHIGSPVDGEVPAWDLYTLTQILPSPRFKLNTDDEYYLTIDGTIAGYMEDRTGDDTWHWYVLFDKHENLWDNMVDLIEYAVSKKWIKKKFMNSTKKK